MKRYWQKQTTHLSVEQHEPRERRYVFMKVKSCNTVNERSITFERRFHFFDRTIDETAWHTQSALFASLIYTPDILGMYSFNIHTVPAESVARFHVSLRRHRSAIIYVPRRTSGFVDYHWLRQKSPNSYADPPLHFVCAVCPSTSRKQRAISLEWNVVHGNETLRIDEFSFTLSFRYTHDNKWRDHSVFMYRGILNYFRHIPWSMDYEIRRITTEVSNLTYVNCPVQCYISFFQFCLLLVTKWGNVYLL